MNSMCVILYLYILWITPAFSTTANWCRVFYSHFSTTAFSGAPQSSLYSRKLRDIINTTRQLNLVSEMKYFCKSVTDDTIHHEQLLSNEKCIIECQAKPTTIHVNLYIFIYGIHLYLSFLVANRQLQQDYKRNKTTHHILLLPSSRFRSPCAEKGD